MADRNTKIRGNQIKDLTITSDDLASDSVTTAKILNDNVTADKIADSAIDDAAKIVDGVISEAKLDINSAPTDTYLLKWNSGAGKLDYVNPATLVSDLGTVVLEGDIVNNEIPSGLINGSNVTFTLANAPEASSVCVFLNGLLQQMGSGKDFTISGSTITFAIAPDIGDVVIVNSIKAS